MTKFTSYLVAFLVANLFTIAATAQNTTISGNVKNSASKEGASAVSVTLKGGSTGTFTDDKGNFRITVKSLPVTLVFTSVGYDMQEVTVNSAADVASVGLKPSNSLGQEIVVSATRVAQRILESPVSVERVSAANIRNAPAASYYDVVSNLKGVDVTTSSLTFKTPSTRGFNGSGSVRVNQLVDGMDNQAPGLNFSVGSVIGLSELDVESMELLPGASSALYGPGGMNGTLLINSKNPFKHQGLSFQVKTGLMHAGQRQRPTSPYHNWSVRWAKKIGEKFAFKISSEIIQARDWAGVDDRNYFRSGTSGQIIPGTRANDPNYDGVNVYGDETTIDLMRNVLIPLAKAAPFLANYVYGLDTTKAINVSRTGYGERDIVNPNTINYKLGGSLNYKITPGIEAILEGYWGTGNTVYTGSERYSLRALKMGQYKLEFLHRNWLLRAYTTQENAGESYNATVTTRLFNEKWKSSPSWYGTYGQTFVAALLAGNQAAAAHTVARTAADQGRPAAGSDQFKQIFDGVRSVPISKGGGLFVDKSDLYNVEGQYNLTSALDNKAEVLIGGNFKRYVLNSEGTLFADSTGTIGINEYGGYLQASKAFLDGRIKITASGRYDKNQNFKGRFTPRATAVIRVAKNNNLRLSYQTAYRFPSTQQQWINLDVGSNVRLLGGVNNFRTFYNMLNNTVYSLESVAAGAAKKHNFTEFKPEAVTSFEAGYKGLLLKDKLLIDMYGYYGQYTDFLTRTVVVQSQIGAVPASLNEARDPSRSRMYSIPVNITDKVKTFGFGIGVDYRLPKNFAISGNFSSDEIRDVPKGFAANFNVPKYRFNATLGNSGFGASKRVGFSVAYRWQDAFFYESDFVNSNLPVVHTVDAQISYKLPQTKSIIKLGANNLANQYYYNAAGNSQIGGLYYLSFGYNVY